MKQIIWYMYLMQNADTHFSNLLVSWLSCYAHSISCIPRPPRRVNMQFWELIRQFVVFQYQLLSYFIYSSCFWYRPSMQVYCWHFCNENFPLSAALHVSVSCSKLERPPSLNCIRLGSRWFGCTPSERNTHDTITYICIFV